MKKHPSSSITWNFPLQKLNTVVTDLTDSRKYTIDENSEIIEPTINTKNHVIRIASKSQGKNVKIKKRLKIKPGDLVFSRLHTQNGSFAYSDTEFTSTSSFIPLFVNESLILKNYLFWVLHVTIPTLQKDDSVGRETYKNHEILELEIPIPEKKTQIIISNKIDSTLKLTNNIKKEIIQSLESIQNYKESFLLEIFSGKSTYEWRKKHSLSSVPKLLEKINIEKMNEYKKNISKKIRTKKPFFCDPSEFIKDIKIPESWEYTFLGNIADVNGGIQKTPLRTPKKNFFPYMGVGNVYRGYLKLEKVKTFELYGDELKNKSLKKNDLLIVEGNGSKSEIGRCAIWNDEIKNCVHQNHIIRVRVNEHLHPEYILSYLNSPQGIDNMINLGRTANGLYNLSVNKIRNISIPIPSPNEQLEIIKKIKFFEQKFQNINNNLLISQNYVDKIFESILQNIFLK
tara:strand:- start:132 stop:1499 length:1368 start_codon:yes stop_codon:yes gene_type:complete